MKDRKNWILILGFAITLVLSVLADLIWWEVVELDFPIDAAYMAWAFPALPFFCIQYFICRVTPKTGIRSLPLVLMLIVIAGLGFGAATASGWDSLGYLLLLMLCPAPLVGCAAGWGTYWIRHRKDKIIDDKEPQL